MYERRLDRNNPGCVMILLDQSGSMDEPIAGGAGRSKADALASAINNLLYELVIRCVKDPNEGPRNYYDIGLISYGEATRSAWRGGLEGRTLVPVREVADNPVRVDTVASTRADGDASTTAKAAKAPIWIEPTAAGRTPMSAAFNLAGRLVAEWVREHPDSFPPIVVNISDGAATDGNPQVWSERIRGLSTRDGNVLLFNLNLSVLEGEPLYFPSDDTALTSDYARTLFAMSSPLPDYMRQIALGQGIATAEGARGFVFNAGIEALVKFLQIGTATSQAVA